MTKHTCINVDDMNDSELKALSSDTTAHKSIQNYAELKRLASSYRLCGNISEALRFEKQMDIVYETLPKHLKW